MSSFPMYKDESVNVLFGGTTVVLVWCRVVTVSNL